MKLIDLHKQISSVTNTSTVTLGAAVSGFQTLAQAMAAGGANAVAVGDSGVPFFVRDPVSGAFEAALYTITSATLLTRESILSSSNGNAAVAFGGASVEVYSSIPAFLLARAAFDRDVAFSQSVPLTQVGIAWMAPITTTGPLSFTPAAGAVKGAYSTCRVTGDGTSDVSAPGFRIMSGSGTYDKTAGTVNILEFSYDGNDYLWGVAQRGTATADTIAPVMSGALSSSSITTSGFTLTWTAATDNIAVAGYEVSTDGGATYASVGNVLTWSATSKTAGTAYQCSVRAFDAANNKAAPLALTVTTTSSSDTTVPTMTGTIGVTSITQSGYVLSWSAGSDNVAVAGYEYSLDGGTTYLDAGNVLTKTITGRTAGATDQVRVRDYDAAGNRGTPLSASVTMNAATAPDAPTIGTATAGDTTATVTWTAPANNGGSAITGYTITAYNASTNASIGTASAAAGATSGTVTGLTNGTGAYLKVAATNGVGTGAQSSASNSVTPAAVDWPRLGTLTTAPNGSMTESGTGPYTYAGGGTAFASEKGGLTTKKMPSGGSGYLQFKILSAAAEVEVGFRNVQSTNVYTSQLTGFYSTTGSGAVPAAYRIIGGSNNANAPAAGDELRVGRDATAGAWKIWLCRSGSSTWIEIASWTSSYNAGDIWIDVVCAGTSSIQLTGGSGLV